MMDVQHLLVRHRRLLRVAWLLAVLVLAACQPDTNGGGGGGGVDDGY